jgi:hypothetical protein
MSIASKLIHDAELAAVRMGIKQLFVSTEISNLYQKQGWYVIKNSLTGSILEKTLPAVQFTTDPTPTFINRDPTLLLNDSDLPRKT